MMKNKFKNKKRNFKDDLEKVTDQNLKEIENTIDNTKNY